jgi:hypothetical protein
MCPELVLCRLFVPQMEDKACYDTRFSCADTAVLGTTTVVHVFVLVFTQEAVLVVGAERFSEFSGYSIQQPVASTLCTSYDVAFTLCTYI